MEQMIEQRIAFLCGLPEFQVFSQRINQLDVENLKSELVSVLRALDFAVHAEDKGNEKDLRPKVEILINRINYLRTSTWTNCQQGDA